MTNLPRVPQHVEGFAQGRLIGPVSFELRSAGPKAGEFDPTPRYPDGTPIKRGFSTGTNRGRPRKGTGLGIGHTKEAKAQMVERYKSGEGLQTLAAAYSTTVQRVREIVIQAGATIRPFQQKKTNEQRSDDMTRKLDKNAVRELLLMHSEGKPLAEIATRFGVSKETVSYHVARRDRGLKSNPAPRKKGVAFVDPPEDVPMTTVSAPPSPAMDDPTPDAAAPEPSPVVVELARGRARELHASAGDSRVIAVQELPSPLLARKQYSVPRILESGSMIDVANPHAAAKLVEGLVARLNEVPGVQAYFEWRAEGRTGQPLGR